jgi:hypothetical protein
MCLCHFALFLVLAPWVRVRVCVCLCLCSRLSLSLYVSVSVSVSVSISVSVSVFICLCLCLVFVFVVIFVFVLYKPLGCVSERGEGGPSSSGILSHTALLFQPIKTKKRQTRLKTWSCLSLVFLFVMSLSMMCPFVFY